MNIIYSPTLVIAQYFLTLTVTGLESGAANESVIIWSLAENRSICNITVPQQVAVIKLFYPDILICGHLDGFITTVYLKPIKDSNTPTRSSATSANESTTSKMLYKRNSFRGHTSAVISLEFNKASISLV